MSQIDFSVGCSFIINSTDTCSETREKVMYWVININIICNYICQNQSSHATSINITYYNITLYSGDEEDISKILSNYLLMHRPPPIVTGPRDPGTSFRKWQSNHSIAMYVCFQPVIAKLVHISIFPPRISRKNMRIMMLSVSGTTTGIIGWL